MSAEEVLIIDSDDDSPNPPPNSVSIKDAFLEITLSDSESDEDIVIEDQVIKNDVQFVCHSYRSHVYKRRKIKRLRKDCSNSGSVADNSFNENQSKDILNNTIDEKIDPMIAFVDIKSERFNDSKCGSVVDNNCNEIESKDNMSNTNVETTDPMIASSDIISKSINDSNSDSVFDSNSNKLKQLTNSCAVVCEQNGLTSQQNDDSNSLTESENIADSGHHLDAPTDNLLQEIYSNGSPKEENNTKTGNEETKQAYDGGFSWDSFDREDPPLGEYYVCSYEGCDEFFNNVLLHYKHEKKHLREIQNLGIRTFRCGYKNCQFRALTQIELIYHNSEHRGIFKCRKPDCLFQGDNSKDIDEHMKAHQNPNKGLNRNKKSYCDCGQPVCDEP